MTQSRRRDVEFNHLASYRRAAFMTLAEARQGIRLEARRQREVASLAWESGETDGCLRTSPFMANRNTRSPRRRCGHDHSLSSVAIPGEWRLRRSRRILRHFWLSHHSEFT